MKKLFIICLFAFIVSALSAQQGYQIFYNDTVNGDTVTNTSSVNVPYNGIVTWDYTVTGNAADDTIYIDFQGSNDTWTTYQTLSTTTFIQGTTSANQHLVDNPAEYLRYRTVLRAYEISDTAFFSNQLFIYKR